MTPTTHETYTNYYIGDVNGEKIYLRPPSWDCGWYWGFGYLGNTNCHYHVDGLKRTHGCNLFDAFRREFGDTFKITDSDLWQLCELFELFYHFKAQAELYHRGGMGLTTIPSLTDEFKDESKWEHVVGTIMPRIFHEIYTVLGNAQNKYNESQTAKVMKDYDRLSEKLADAQKELDLYVEANSEVIQKANG